VALYSAGYTQKECSEVIGTTRAAVGYMYKRAIERMRLEVTDGA
jgi:transcriptional regulator